MTKTEIRATSAIALIYSLRIFGLAMVMPVFMLMAPNLRGYSESLAGLAIGAYGLSQAFLQIPYGMLSDRYGRKPLIAIGLVVFGLGSCVAGGASSIYGVIAGRFLQGAGAVAGVLMALVGDVTGEESRTKAMATIGMAIGCAFSLSLVAGPLLGHALGLGGIFYTTALLGAVGLPVLFFLVPSPPESRVRVTAEPASRRLTRVLRNGRLLRLDYGVMTLHICLVAFFVAVPPILQDQLGIPKPHHAWVYLSVVIPSFFGMLPFIVIGEKKHKMKQVIAGAVVLMAVALVLLAAWHTSLSAVWIFIFLFFLAFNLLEATLPSLVSKECAAGDKGTAMGVFSTCQFLGAFVGGASGGFIVQHGGTAPELLTIAVALLIWLTVVASMPEPRYSTNLEVEPTSRQ